MKTKLPSMMPGSTGRFSTYALCKVSMLLLLSAICHLVYGQVELIRDINQYQNPLDKEYGEAVNRNGALLFTSNSELWITNGTVSGTRRLKAFNAIHSLTHINGVVYFAADDGTGLELWRATGTNTGTVKVKDINSGAGSSAADQFTVAGSILYFVANNGIHGRELWKSDGTAAGTVMVKDILRNSGSSNPSALTFMNGYLYFSANDGINGYELWKTDGTTAGTVIVKDVKPGSRLSSSPQFITNGNGTLYFTADDGISGRELWKSNGTAGGTVKVKDIITGSKGAIYHNLTDVNGVLFFSANDGIHGEELWKSNGTASGTVMVKDLTSGPKGSSYQHAFSQPMGNFTSINNKLYFTAHLNGAFYFWKSDGTAAGTIPFLPAEGPGMTELEAQFTLWNGNVYFFNGGSQNPTIQITLLKEDPSGKITKVISRLLNDYYESKTPFLVQSGTGLYFTGRELEGDGHWLWKTNGTTSGTYAVRDTYIIQDLPSDPKQFVTIGNTVFFTVNILQYEQVYKTNGTEAGTQLIKQFTSVGNMTSMNGQLYFSGYNETPGSGWYIYKSNGTWETTTRIPFERPNTHGTPNHFTVSGSKLFFTWDTDDLYVTDGTTTKFVVSMPHINTMYGLNGYLYFRGYDDVYGSELWRTDGTPEGTQLVKDINPQFGHSSIENFTSRNGILYFSANDGVHGHELWRSDGTAAGTYMVKDARVDDNTNDRLFDVLDIVATSETVYFTSEDGNGNWKLWKSDGTASGTSALAVIPYPTETFVSNTTLYLIGYDGNSYNLWKSNGTTATTHELAVLSPYLSFSSPPRHVTINNVVYFVSEGRLWRSDGTTCGTYTLGDIDGNPGPVAALGYELIFGRNDPDIGRELFKVNVNNLTPGPCGTATAARTQAENNVPEEMEEAIGTWPNPFQTDLTLQIKKELDGTYEAAIYTINGLQVEDLDELRYNELYKIGNTWKPGIYVMRIQERNKLTVRKIVKK